MRVNDRPLHREEVSVMGSFIKEDWFKERKKEAKEAVKAQKLAEKKRQASVKKSNYFTAWAIRITSFHGE